MSKDKMHIFESSHIRDRSICKSCGCNIHHSFFTFCDLCTKNLIDRETKRRHLFKEISDKEVAKWDKEYNDSLHNIIS
jgi:hypothetical protein